MMSDNATIGFVMSHACPLKCDFCCHDRATMGPGRVTLQMVRDSMVRFSGEKSVVEFAFSGGEPFLYIQDIIEAVRGARREGMAQPFHIVTSAYWAGKGKTRTLLDELWSLGMAKIIISYDHEHARWVTPEQIMEVCEAAQDIGMEIEVWGTFWDEAEDVRDLLPDIERFAKVESHIALQAGRAKRSGRRAKHDMPEHRKYSCGRPAHYSVAIFPDGEAFPCCSGDFNRSAKLSCGNVHRNTAAEILAEAYGNFHVRTVKELGWGVLYEVIEREFPELSKELPSFADVESPCEICRVLNLTLKDKLKPVYEMIEREYIQTMAEFAWDRQTPCAPLATKRLLGNRIVTREQMKTLLAEDEAVRRECITGLTTLEIA